MTAFQKFQYYLILIVFRILTLLPLWAMYLISELFTILTYYVFGYRKKVVFENLQKSFPEKKEDEIRQIARKYYRHLSALIVENIYLRFVSKKNLQKRILLENRELLDNLHKQGKNIIAMLGHTGNWEFPAALFQSLPYWGAAAYKQLSSTPFDKIYYDIRKRAGVEPVEMNDVLRKILEWNKKEEPYILCMVADQAPAKSDKNHWIQFLNQDTVVYLGSEKLAKKYDMAVVYIKIVKCKKGIYKITPQLITSTPKDTAEFEITEKYFQLLEESIVENPPYWLWSHRRWKHKRIN